MTNLGPGQDLWASAPPALA